MYAQPSPGGHTEGLRWHQENWLYKSGVFSFCFVGATRYRVVSDSAWWPCKSSVPGNVSLIVCVEYFIGSVSNIKYTCFASDPKMVTFFFQSVYLDTSFLNFTRFLTLKFLFYPKEISGSGPLSCSTGTINKSSTAETIMQNLAQLKVFLKDTKSCAGVQSESSRKVKVTCIVL